MEEILKTFKENFHGFDIFMILFTVVLVWGAVREIRRQPKNLFALGFLGITLLVFGLLDVLMVLNWFGVMPQIHLFPKP
jgi:hypothetical protein